MMEEQTQTHTVTTKTQEHMLKEICIQEREGEKRRRKRQLYFCASVCFCFRLNVVILKIVKMLKSAGSEKVSGHSGVIICRNLPN